MDDAQKLIMKIRVLQKSEIGKLVDKRLKEFSRLFSEPEQVWFSELCFCILAANAKGKNALLIQQELGAKLQTLPEHDLAAFIRSKNHRFHNMKACYICLAREQKGFRKILRRLIKDDEKKAREWLILHIRGIGMKEASHFLRNIGCEHFAIIDRHVLSIVVDHKVIKRPASITKKVYLDCERWLEEICHALSMSQAELDLYLWYMKTGVVMK